MSVSSDLNYQVQKFSSEGATLVSRVIELEQEIETVKVQLSNKEIELQEALNTIKLLENEIKLLKDEILRLNPLPPVPPVPPNPIPPIEVAPNIKIKLGDITFQPSITNDKQGNEIRYSGKLPGFNDEVNVIIDTKTTDNQVAICFERCYIDPNKSFPILTHLKIDIGSDTKYDAPLRLHYNTRPRFISNPSNPPRIATEGIRELISLSILPNYNTSYKPDESDIIKVSTGQPPWTRWQDENSNYDPISEEYGQVIDSWTGGAGEKMNEASHIMPVQHMYLMSGDSRLWSEVVKLASSSGNYAIHYKTRDGRVPRADETAGLPFLQGDVPVTLYTANGTKLPVPEPAHQHDLTYIAYILTGERWYLEELKHWHLYDVMTRPKNTTALKDRLNGIIWSGQVRAFVWSLNTLLHTYIASGYDKYYGTIISNNLNWMTSTFTIPLKSPEYRSTGVPSIQPFRPSNLLQYVKQEPRPLRISTWNIHILCSVLNECLRNGFQEAKPMLTHCLKVAKGIWETHNHWLVGWGEHAFPNDSWNDITRVTFEGMTSQPTFFPNLTTPDYIAWYRSAVVAGVDQGELWAREALTWIDFNAPKYKGGIPPWWMINPVKV